MGCVRIADTRLPHEKSLWAWWQGKVSRLHPPNEGSLAGWPPVRLEPRTHRLRGWIIDFPSQVPRRLLDYPEPVQLLIKPDDKLHALSIKIIYDHTRAW